MSAFDTTLIDPEPEQWDAALADAVTAANARFRTKTIPWPLPGLADFVLRLMREPEGMQGWHGGKKPDYWEARSQVAVAWWSDRLRRKHVRILGGHGKNLCTRMRFHIEGIGLARLSPLEQVYPGHTARIAGGGANAILLGVCDCGAIGPPESLAWMGTCCGPCHDRRAEGEAPHPPLAFSPEPTICRQLAFSPDSRKIALSHEGLWRRDLATGSVEQLTVRGHLGHQALGFTADGRQLIALDNHGANIIDLDDPENSKGAWSFGRESGFIDCALSPEAGLVAVSGAEEERVELRDAFDGTVRRSLAATDVNRPTAGVGFSRDGKMLATASYDSPLRIWDTKTGNRLHEFPVEKAPTDMAFSPDGKLLAGLTILRADKVQVWDLVARKELPALPFPRGGRAVCLGFSPTGRILAVGGNHGTLSLWDLDKWSEWEGDPDAGRLDLQWSEGEFLHLASSPDGKWLAVSDNAAAVGLYVPFVRLWPWAALRDVGSRAGHDEEFAMKRTDASKKEAAFIESILANPLEIDHSLIYADWLEDQDDPRAEFVRLAVSSGEPNLTDPERAALDKRIEKLRTQFDPWWSSKILAPAQIRGLVRLTESRFGAIDELYDKKLYSSRCLHRPAARKAVVAAERSLGFPLPPLLGLVYTCLGNGGLVISALGLPGGQTGFDDVGFHNKDIVTGYKARVAFGKWLPDEDETEPWPDGLVPLYDGLGCGMVDYIDCTDPQGPIWRSDSGDLSRRLDSLEEYLIDRLNFWRLD